MHIRALLVIAVLLLAGAAGASEALAAPQPALVAAYQATPPTSGGAGTLVPVAVTVLNAGDEVWPGAGATPVNLSYHWYDLAGNAVVWNGNRGAIGLDMAPAASRTVTVPVLVPPTPGQYVLRFALVKEGVAWFNAGPPHAFTVNATFQAAFGQVALPPFVATGTYTVAVPVTNSGVSAWNAAGANPITVSYHWHDAAGNTVVWDGLRTPLTANVPAGSAPAAPAAPPAPVTTPSPVTTPVPVVTPNPGPGQPAITPTPTTQPVSAPQPVTTPQPAPGATPVPAPATPGGAATVQVRVTAPDQPGQYTLTIDLVREGVGWFALLGPTTPFKQLVSVAAVSNAVTYTAEGGAAVSGYIGEARTARVTVTNSGNVPITTSGPNPVSLAYHLLDERGGTIAWEGPRTPLGGDLAPGQSRQVTVAYTAPASPGSYTLALDLVKEGVAWYSGIGVPTGRVGLTVTSGLSAGYGASTTPSLATIGATLQLSVEVTNYGPRTWSAGGANPVSLSYHLFNSSGQAVVWDGRRGLLPRDVLSGQAVKVTIDVALPQTVGDYRISWDMVQEGVAWFSSYGVVRKDEPVSVQPGVTFYGKGFGHGLGMSQYGAQGWATGAVGTPLTGEQIVAKYYPGTNLLPIDLSRGQLRVLLSQPTSSPSYTCGMPYFNGSIASLLSDGGFRVVTNDGATEIVKALPGIGWQITARLGGVQVWNQNTGAKVYDGAGPVVVLPTDPLKPTRIAEKGLYRGDFRFTNLGNTLRVINFVQYDEYVRGVIPKEMPREWHLEAYKAQAYAARTYAYTKYAAGTRDFDTNDDQSDQCYGGVEAETAITDQAVAATAGKVIAYNGAPIRAYFASSNGGYSLGDGCWGNNVRTVNGEPQCGTTQPYLAPIPDPADLAVTKPVANRNAQWSVSFTSPQVRDAIIRYRNVDIGTLLSVDVSNQVPVNVGHVVSVKIRGSNASVDLPADTFLRTYLGLKSTMVRLNPF